MQYLDFEIEVLAGDGGDAGGYTVRVLRSPAGEATSAMRMPFTGLALQNNLQALQIALLRSGTTRRRVETAESQTVQKFGNELWNALFSGDIRGRYEATRNEAKRQDAGVRIKLRFDTPELAALPWEYLFDAGRGDYVALSGHTPVVRYIPLPEAVEPFVVQPPLRVLGMVVSPSDLPALDVDREKQRLEMALGDLSIRGLVELEWMPGGTWRDLRQVLREGPWHVFHFIGHGGFDEIRGEGLVIFGDDAGKAERVSATNLGRLLGEHDALRLAVLNSCESARGDELDVFSSTAATLVRRGTPAVIAMQYEITDDAAIEFSRSFYEAVGSGIPVDSALADARIGVALSNDGSLEWGTPVLYTRAPDGVLFDIASPPLATAPPSVATAPSMPAPPPLREPIPSESKRPEPTPMVAVTAEPAAAPPLPAPEPVAAELGSRAAAWTPPAKDAPSRRKIIAGIVVAMVGVLLVAAIAQSLTPASERLDPGASALSLASIDDVPIGSCFDERTDRLLAMVVPCDGPHQLEMIGAEVLPDGLEAPYPGAEAMAEQGDNICRPLFEAYVGIDYDSSELAFWYYAPDEEGWPDGDRVVDCAIGNEERSMQPPGSARNARR